MATDNRLKEQLRRQLSFLDHSSDAYDRGLQDEAIRIATTIRVLVHQTKNSTSLLKHLGATEIHLLSTCRDIRPMLDGSDPFYAGTRIRLFNGMALFGDVYRAKLGSGSVRQPRTVSDWWSQVVYALDDGTKLTRKDIVLAAADKDGGAHVDIKLTTEYELLLAPGSLGTLVFEQGGETENQPITDGHFVALRQMAYELLNSPELLALVS
jgi:hypothetical protein